ncbi:MAG: Ig-like domain-containing protein [Thermoplasmatota archaeon]
MSALAKLAAVLCVIAIANFWPLAGGAEGIRWESGGGGPEGHASARSTITFPFSGGSDTSLRISAPSPARVLNASIELEGRSAMPPPTERRVVPSCEGCKAYEGATKESPPKSGPSSYQSQVIPQPALVDCSEADGASHTTMTYGAGSPYQLFRFRVSEGSVSGLRVRWVGTGFDILLDWTEAYIYIYRSGSWECLGGVEYDGADFQYYELSRTIAAGAQSYIDGEGMVNVLATGPFGLFYCGVETDLVELAVSGSTPVWPTDLSLDMGADGAVEYQMAGELRGMVHIDAEALREPLQSIIDMLQGAPGPIDVAIEVSSRTGGVVEVLRADFSFDLPPVFRPIPPEAACFDEDTDAPGLIDLDAFCRDDLDQRLRYELLSQPEDGKILAELAADGHTLGFRSPHQDWFGTRPFTVRATDSSGLSALAQLNVTVRPVNDPPTFSPVRDQTAREDLPFSLVIVAHDVDDPPSNLTYSDDCPLFDIDPRDGGITFTPTNGQVGRYAVTVSVEDTKGASSHLTFCLTVENANDPPEVEGPERLEAVEDEPFEHQILARDMDPGDALTYSVESDIEGLEADPGTGLVEFVFTNAHVGEHELEFVATDGAGESASWTCKLVVLNVNDPPWIEEGRELDVRQGETLEYTVMASDPDIGDSLTFSTSSRLVEMDGRTGTLSLTPGNDDVGTHKVPVTVRDSAGAEASSVFVVIVENVNDPPRDVTILAPLNGSRFREGERVALSGRAVDPDEGDVLTLTWKEDGRVLGSGASASVELRPGRHLILLEASDGELKASALVTVFVDEAGAPGTVVPLGALSWGAALAGAALAVACAAALSRRKKRRGPGASAPPPQPLLPPVAQVQPTPAPPAQPQIAAPAAGASMTGAFVPPAPLPGAAAAPAPSLPSYQPHPSLNPLPTPAAPPMNLPDPPQHASASGGVCPADPPAAPAPSPAPASPQPPVRVGTASAAADHPVEPPEAEPVAERCFESVRERDMGAGGGRSAREGLPLGYFQSLKPAEDTGVTKDAMRAAVMDAREAIRAGRAAGIDLSECERLLAEAIACSYRLDYTRARNLAKKAEAVAVSLLERVTAEE